MNEIVIIERQVAEGVVSTDTQVVTLEPTDPLFVVSAGEQGPPGVMKVAIGTPASSSAPGEQGEILMDSGFVYLCVSQNTWRRAALSSF